MLYKNHLRVLSQENIAMLGERHSVNMSSFRMPRGVKDRLFCGLTYKVEETLMIGNKDLSDINEKVAILIKDVLKLQHKKHVLGRLYHYGFRFKPAKDGCVVSYIICFDPRECPTFARQHEPSGHRHCKDFGECVESIRALENAYRQSLVVEEGELLTDAEDGGYSLPRLPHTATSLAEGKDSSASKTTSTLPSSQNISAASSS